MKETTTDSAHVTAEWIRRPLPDLGGIPPVDAVNEPEARRKLDDLLTELAGHHQCKWPATFPAADLFSNNGCTFLSIGLDLRE